MVTRTGGMVCDMMDYPELTAYASYLALAELRLVHRLHGLSRFFHGLHEVARVTAPGIK